MKTKPAAAANKATVDEDEDEPKKIRFSRSKRRHARRSFTESESPPRKRSKKFSKRSSDKKSSKRSKVSSRRRRRRSPSPSPSISSSSPSSVSRGYSRRSCSTCSSASERSVSPPPRSRSRDVKKGKGRGWDREKDWKRKKARRSTSCSGSITSSSSDGSRSRSRSRKQGMKDGATKYRTEKDYDNRHASRSEKNLTDDVCRDENALVIAKEGENEIEGYEKNLSLDKIENPPSKDANETTDVLPAAGGSPVPEAEDLELILRQKALENFRKFRAEAAKARKTDNGATGKEILTGSLQNDGTKAAEANSAAVSPFQRQPSSLGVRHPTVSPRSEDCGNGTSRSWKEGSSAGMSRRVRSPGILEDGCPTQQEGSMIEATPSTFQPRSPQDGRSTRNVMQSLVSTPGSSSSVNQRLGSSVGVTHVNGAPRIRSVVSIPPREGPDDSSYTTPHRLCGSSAPGEINSEIKHNPTDVNRTDNGHTNGDDRKTSEALASNGSILSPAEGESQATEARVEDKDGSQFQKKTFSRMHDGETVEVSYKVYIPKKTPALARRKLQR